MAILNYEVGMYQNDTALKARNGTLQLYTFCTLFPPEH
jgi:hypothetical protein